MKRRKKMTILAVILAGFHLLALLAGFLAPYDYAQQNRSLTYAPPSHFHFRDDHGAFHLRPYICGQAEEPDSPSGYREDPEHCSSISFLTQGPPYSLFGIFESRLHLFGVSKPAQVFLMGTDQYGRDVFSRVLSGAQVSLFCGLLATALSVSIGAFLGILAGYFGGWIDSVVMRCAETFLALPWLYLLFGIRASLPLRIDSRQAFLLIIAVVGAVGWSRPARLVRGIVLSGKERHHIFAARTFGASHAYILRRHVLPQTYSVLLTQAVLLIPQYVLAEVTLSFLGLGVGEPAPSWGNMLATLQKYEVLVSYWWMWAPGFALVLVSFTYAQLANVMQEGADGIALT